MSSTNPQVGSVGLAIRLQFGGDISSASKIWYTFAPPNRGLKFNRDAGLASNGDATKADYVVAQGDLELAGDWRVQGFARLADGSRLPSRVVQFRLEANIGTASLAFASPTKFGVLLSANPLTTST